MPSHDGAMVGRADLDRPEPQRPFGRVGPALSALQEAADAQDQLACGKRLGDVVVRAQLEPEHAIDLLAPRRQQDHRDHPRLGAGPHLLEHLDPGQLGEHPIQNDQVGRLALQRLERGDAVRRDADLESLFGEDVAQQLGDVGFVFDHEQGLRHGALACLRLAHASKVPNGHRRAGVTPG